MVQLKCSKEPYTHKPLLSFNSCMVQLKFPPVSESWVHRGGFNSCMVQLKSRVVADRRYNEIGFNSCMVQLKYLLYQIQPCNHIVLIPVWCN